MEDKTAYADRSCNTLVLLHVLLAILDFRARGIVVANKFHTHVFLAATELWSIDGDEQCLDPTSLCILDIFLRNFTVAVHVPGSQKSVK